MAWQGKAGRGSVRCGVVRQGLAWQGREFRARYGLAWLGPVRHGSAGYGSAGYGSAEPRRTRASRHDKMRRGRPWRGTAENTYHLYRMNKALETSPSSTSDRTHYVNFRNRGNPRGCWICACWPRGPAGRPTGCPENAKIGPGRWGGGCEKRDFLAGRWGILSWRPRAGTRPGRA